MSVFYVVLGVLGMARSIEGALLFTQQPADTVYLQEGSTANLTWTYTTDNRTTELRLIVWSIFNETSSKFIALIVEEKDGTVKYNPNAPSTYGPERVAKEGQASLVIKNVTFKDSAIYKCLLDGETGIADAENSVEVIITGHPLVFPLVKYVNEGESATLNCNATGVPGPNITWKRKTEQDELQIINNNDSKYEIISSGSGTSQLLVKDNSIIDHGYYVCDTSAIVSQLSLARGFLGVKSLSKYFDACPSTNQSASKGVPTTICCPVRGFPPPEVTWNWPDGTEQKTGSTILPITPKAKDFGTYTCKAVGLDPDPVIIPINLREEGLKTSITAEDITQFKQGDKFIWSEVKGAVSYICRICGPDIDCSSVLGDNPFLEIPYSSLNFKSEKNKPDSVQVMIEVLAVGDNDVLGKGGPFNLTISGATTAALSFTLVIVMFISAVLL